MTTDLDTPTTMDVMTADDHDSTRAARCGRPEKHGLCLRPLRDVEWSSYSADIADAGRCSRHGWVTANIVMGRPRDTAGRGRRPIGGRSWQVQLGEDLDAAVDARAAADGTTPHDALRAMMREKVAADQRRRPRPPTE